MERKPQEVFKEHMQVRGTANLKLLLDDELE
jgi:hypothetical protein